MMTPVGHPPKQKVQERAGEALEVAQKTSGIDFGSPFGVQFRVLFSVEVLSAFPKLSFEDLLWGPRWVYAKRSSLCKI